MNTLNKTATEGIAGDVQAMCAARDQLAAGAGALIRTSEAIKLLPMELSEETLLGYPDWILPRFVVNPRAKRRTYVWDPRDLLALPYVLRRWEQAIQEGATALEEFRAKRLGLLRSRERAALGLPEEAA